MKIVLGVIALIMVGVPLSMEIIAMVVSLTTVVSLSTVCSISVNVHGDRGIVHPSWGIGGVVLGHALPLWMRVIPMWSLLLRSKGFKVSVSSKHVPKEYFRSYAGKGLLSVLLVCDGCRVAHYIFGDIPG